MKGLDLKTCKPEVRARIEASMAKQAIKQASERPQNALDQADPCKQPDDGKRVLGGVETQERARYKSKAEAWTANYLERLRAIREIDDYEYESMTCVLAPARGCLKATRYTVDFLVRYTDRTTGIKHTKGVEVKGGGFVRPTGMVKLKVAGSWFARWGIELELWNVSKGNVEIRRIV